MSDGKQSEDKHKHNQEILYHSWNGFYYNGMVLSQREEILPRKFCNIIGIWNIQSTQNYECLEWEFKMILSPDKCRWRVWFFARSSPSPWLWTGAALLPENTGVKFGKLGNGGGWSCSRAEYASTSVFASFKSNNYSRKLPVFPLISH